MIPGFILTPLAKAGDLAITVAWEVTSATWHYIKKRR